MSTDLALKSDPRALQFKHLLESDRMQASLRQALPRHITPSRMLRLVLGVFQVSPKVLDCTPESVLGSIMRAAAYGLELGAGFGAEAYLVPFWDAKSKRYACQFIPGFRGLCKLARQSGEIADIWAEVVYELDECSYELGLRPTLRHVRNDTASDPGPLKYAYAVARFRDGERKFVVLNRREVEKIRDSSSSRNKEGKLVGPWIDWPEEMWKKTAVRRLCKMLPLSVEIQQRVLSEEGSPDATGEPLAVDLSLLPLPAIADEAAAEIIETPPQEEVATVAKRKQPDQLFDSLASATEAGL